MKRIFSQSLGVAPVVLLISSFGGASADAQNGPPGVGGVLNPAAAPNRAGRSAPPRILDIDAAHLGQLATLATRGDVNAISLSAALARLRADPAAQGALAQWVRDGGVVFLHTDAAQFFGYHTVRARTTTNAVAGQLFGRARAALPFGAHPLLWGALGNDRAGGNGGDNAGQGGESLGVHTVFYEMREGDHLVLDHPAGVPLLRVTDLAQPEQQPLYAAAIAPYGRGWAVFTPAVVETHRGDGAAFLQNLKRLIAASARASRTTPGDADPAASQPGAFSPGGMMPGNTLTSLPATLIERSGAAFSHAGAAQLDFGALAQQFKIALDTSLASPGAPDTLSPDVAGGVPPVAPALGVAPDPKLKAPRLMLTQREAQLTVDLLGAARANAALRPHAQALIALLCARLELQRNDLSKADAWLQQVESLRPDTAEPLLWRGIIAAGQAEDITLSSPQRASLLGVAATSWQKALGAGPLVRIAATPRVPGAVSVAQNSAALSGATDISGVPRALIQSWGAASSFAANMMSVEPPLTQLFGTLESGLVLRNFPNDPTLRLAGPAAALVARSGSILGWHAAAEELLIFPTPQYYAAYRRAAGTPQSVPNPTGSYGDISGSRILMMAQPSLPIILPPARPGLPPRVTQLGSSVAPIISQLHAYVLINSLAEGGTPVPDWMQLGIVGLTGLKVSGAGAGVNSLALLRPYAAAGQLLNAQQFQGVSQRTGGNGYISGLAEAQGATMMDYFYARFGAGNVVETLQRLGAGQSVDDALNATAGMNEQQFFESWYNAMFGR